mmetsp:Transcript_11448/g.29339  ORF Transcript_11448/g.29339 Transcript_11448/m.29339 type:complete len:308 (+) Transcript_11448:215-1138(+)
MVWVSREKCCSRYLHGHVGHHTAHHRLAARGHRLAAHHGVVASGGHLAAHYAHVGAGIHLPAHHVGGRHLAGGEPARHAVLGLLVHHMLGLLHAHHAALLLHLLHLLHHLHQLRLLRLLVHALHRHAAHLHRHLLHLLLALLHHAAIISCGMPILELLATLLQLGTYELEAVAPVKFARLHHGILVVLVGKLLDLKGVPRDGLLHRLADVAMDQDVLADLDLEVMGDEAPDVLGQQVGDGVADGGARPGEVAGALGARDEEEREQEPGAEKHAAEVLHEVAAAALGDLVVRLNVHPRSRQKGVDAKR